MTEEIQILFQSGPVRIERIISNGHPSPAGFWYDQEQDEWVILLAGSAELEFEGGAVKPMASSEYLLIPSRQKHRVSQVSEDAVWLAFHFRG